MANINFLFDLRKSLELSQTEMAERMGLSVRPYQELEGGDRQVRPRHIRLAESVALDVAVEKQDPELAPPRVREAIVKLARLIHRENLRKNARGITDMLLD